jgi:hypothetical protein
MMNRNDFIYDYKKLVFVEMRNLHHGEECFLLVRIFVVKDEREILFHVQSLWQQSLQVHHPKRQEFPKKAY